jgi:hypothetical protein
LVLTSKTLQNISRKKKEEENEMEEIEKLLRKSFPENLEPNPWSLYANTHTQTHRLTHIYVLGEVENRGFCF